MKLRNKVVAGFAATVLALSLMVGTAMASTNVLPFDYPNEAAYQTNNDVWVKVIGGSAGEAISTEDVAHNIKSVDVTITGKATFDAELIFNSDAGWVPTMLKAQSVDGTTVLSMPMDGKDKNYVEVVVNLQNKSEGALQVTKMDFKDADGKVILTYGAGAAAPAKTDAAAPAKSDSADTSVPKTGVESFAALFGFGAAVLGSGAVVLRRKQK